MSKRRCYSTFQLLNHQHHHDPLKYYLKHIKKLLIIFWNSFDWIMLITTQHERPSVVYYSINDSSQYLSRDKLEAKMNESEEDEMFDYRFTKFSQNQSFELVSYVYFVLILNFINTIWCHLMLSKKKYLIESPKNELTWI